METSALSCRKRGFTLVELLVVIAIIMVIISMLLPALNRARQQATVVKCESNIRQLLQAVSAYAVDNRGYLPNRANCGYAPLGNTGEEWASLSYTDATGNTVGSNYGLLMAGSYIETEDLAWMNANNPATSLPNYYNLNVAAVRYDPGLDLNSFNVITGNHSNYNPLVYSTSYVFNPHWAFTSTPTTFGNGTATVVATSTTSGSEVSQFNKLAKYDPYYALITDLSMGGVGGNTIVGGLVPHMSKSAWTFNIGFADGHVATVADTILMRSTPYGSGSYQGQGVRMPNGLEAWDSDLDILETEADGRNPMTSGGDPGLGTASSTPPFKLEYRIQPSNPETVDRFHPLVPWL
jgi:prepilin-type N-terminal cleavage/methylation domain-containing protein/prepilin-type processing-associated H-X9-DG protein